jgi:hypothetical protein
MPASPSVLEPIPHIRVLALGREFDPVIAEKLDAQDLHALDILNQTAKLVRSLAINGHAEGEEIAGSGTGCYFMDFHA